MTAPKVFVVDDDESVRAALMNLLRSAGFQAESFATSHSFLAAISAKSRGCVVLDLRLPEIDGLQLQKKMEHLQLNLPIIFVTAHANVRISVAAMKAGAIDFLLKPFAEQELLNAVTCALERNATARLAAEERRTLLARFALLSHRERDVMVLVAKGYLNKQIAAVLRSAEITIKVCRRRVMQKMNATSLADLVRMAAKLELDANDPALGSAAR